MLIAFFLLVDSFMNNIFLEIPATTLASIPAIPKVDCETYDFCILRAAEKAPFGIADAYCQEHDMTLPHPQNDQINSLYAAAGTTWLNVNVNELLNDDSFSNWQRRQRGWLNENGQWKSRDGGDVIDFFCVKPSSIPG